MELTSQQVVSDAKDSVNFISHSFDAADFFLFSILFCSAFAKI